jgi:hypothetical protein
MAASGIGQIQITGFLNQHHVPTLSGSQKWRAGMVAHVLRSQAVIGRYQPCLSIVKHGKRWRVPDPDGPIENYFPAIISDELYRKGRLATSSRIAHHGQRKLPAYRNLLRRLGRCAVCGGPLHHSGDAGEWTYLRCAGARYKECSNCCGIPYRKVESVLFALDHLSDLVQGLLSERSTDTARGRRRTATRPQQDGMVDDYDQELRRIELMDREAFFSRIPILGASAESSDTEQRDPARKALIAGFRRFVEGVVLHANRTLTIHMQAGSDGCRIVYIVDRDGIQGAQVKAPSGRTGFIDRSVVAGLVRPVTRGANTATSAREEPMWQPCHLDALLKRIRLVQSPDGDWHAMAADPMQMAAMVGRAEQTLDVRLRPNEVIT